MIADRFRVEALLGRGAIAAVHRVRDEQTGRRLALKLLRVPRRREGGLLLSQFEREFHTLCQLAHPRIIEVYDYGVLDGSDERAAFYTMELLDGQDLRDRGPLPWSDACAIVRDVASSLAILHSRRLLHRDVSARNVRCTSDGRAKLIDFGAMAPVGVPHQTFGTPPFVPPEAMQQQALDPRADLYSLGALSYLLLTGRHAYPARRLDELGDVWQTHPPRVRAFAPEVPEALDRLVMQLLHPDRMVRPATAAEVMERLAGLADPPLEEPLEVPRAYLATPPLIGREHALSQARTQLADALTRHRGRSLLVEGVAGVGRTRFLDACVLEAKLLGAAVLRADGSTNAGGEFGVARALCSQLSSSLPELARRCCEPWQAVLGPLLQAAPAAPRPAAAPSERRRLLGALRDVLLAVSRSTRLVIAIDDVEQIDDASAALLAMLSHDGENRPLALLFTTDAEAASTPALSLLREIAYPIVLPPLSAAQTRALVRGVFGDVDHVVSVAERMHELSAGNPRWTMASCERLVERGVARYESGSWTLPAELGVEDLPESLSAALAARVQALAPDARDLAATLALTDPAVLPLDRYPALLSYSDSARLYRALDALVTAGVLVSAGSGYRFAQRELVELCLEPRPPAIERERHARIARALEGAGSPTLLAHHLMSAGQERLALDRLLELHTDPTIVPSSFMLALLERAVEAAERLALPARTCIELRVWLADNAAKLGLYHHFIAGAQPLLRELDLASGLADYRLLGADMAPAERLAEALSRARLRSERASPAGGRLSPSEAIPELARLCATFTSMATISQDVALLEQLPSLAPLTSLSAALEIVHRLVQRTIDFQCGRYELAAAGSLEILARLDGEGSGLDPAFEQAVRLGQYYLQGVLAAARGQPSTLDWTEALARNPGHRVNAWRVRMTDALMQGDVEAAEACRRRAELLQLEDGGRMTLPGTTYRIELLAFLYAEDVMGVKRATERLEGVARLHPGWQPTLQIARASYRLLQGDPAAALEVLLPVLDELEPGRHMDWAFAASMHVVLLTALGRSAEAIERGRAYLVLCEREQLAPSVRGHMRALSNALASGGRLEEARELADRALEDTKAAGARGLLLGISHETRARIAAALHDAAGFRHHAERCAAEFHLDRNLALRAKYERLLLFARAHGAMAPEAFDRARAVGTVDRAGPAREVRRRLSACADAAERAGAALSLSLEATRARAGWLFGLREGRLRLMAGTGEAPTPRMVAAVDGYLKSELENAGATTMLDGSTAELGPATMTFDEGDRRFEPLLLFGSAAGRPAIAAVAVLQRDELAGPPQRALLEALGTALLECDDADPVTWLGG